VACDGTEIVGFASYACEGDAVDLVMLNVLPRWQGRGAARALIAAVTEVARTDGAARIIVATSNDDLPALGLYQRLGFTITEVCVGELLEHHGGVESGFAGIPVRDEVRMELRV
jgi:ribosomal protein S18 acetylase RimI-like enzyme